MQHRWCQTTHPWMVQTLYKFSILVMQLQLCDQSVRTCLLCHCFAEEVWSALLDWHSWLMGCGSYEGGFLLFFFWVCSHAMPWSRLLCALMQFPVVCIPLCCNSILSLPALVSCMTQRNVRTMCVTVLSYLWILPYWLCFFVCRMGLYCIKLVVVVITTKYFSIKKIYMNIIDK